MNELKCEKCNSLMRKIPLFARAMPEGVDAEKDDNLEKYECIFQGCENEGKIIKVKK